MDIRALDVEGMAVDDDQLRDRYLAATGEVAESAHRRGDSGLSLPLRAHELSVALSAGKYEAAMPAFEELTAYYVSTDAPEPWLVTALSWASGRFADHFRDRPPAGTPSNGYATAETLLR